MEAVYQQKSPADAFYTAKRLIQELEMKHGQ